MATFCILLSSVFAGQASSHEESNPVYRSLRERGVLVDTASWVALPSPTLPAGATQAEQMEAVGKVAKIKNYPLDYFMRRSPVAPYVLQIHELERLDAQTPVKGVDAWFVMYGDLDALTQGEFRAKLLNLTQGSGEPRELTAAELAKRGLAADAALDEFFAHRSFNLFKRVDVSDTKHVVMTKTADSLILAAHLEPVFASDPQFPNQWRPVIRDSDGVGRLGPPQPYSGSGSYLKITRLAGAKDALFAEFHLAFVEPPWLVRRRQPAAV